MKINRIKACMDHVKELQSYVLRSGRMDIELKMVGQCGSSLGQGHGKQDHGCILFIKDKSSTS